MAKPDFVVDVTAFEINVVAPGEEGKHVDNRGSRGIKASTLFFTVSPPVPTAPSSVAQNMNLIL